MAKNKYQLSQIHKVKIHHNRWLIWAIAYLCFIFIALLGYIQISSVNVETEELTAENSFQPWHPYKNEELKFSLRYPDKWSIEPASQTSVDFVPEMLSRPGVNVSVYASGDEKSIRAVLDVQSENKIEVDGIPATRLTTKLAGNETETVVLVKKDGRLYVLRGTLGSVSAFLQTFKFIQ